MLRKKVKLFLEYLQVCIFAQIVFGVRCTLNRKGLVLDLLFTVDDSLDILSTRCTNLLIFVLVSNTDCPAKVF